jgi:hypothetical protein
MDRVIALLLCVPLAACRDRGRPPASGHGQPAEIAGAFPGAPAAADTAALRAYTVAVDSLAEGAGEELYAVVNGQLVPVPDEASWPDLAEARIHLLRAADGSPRRHVEIPVSESGDWSVAAVHYFDREGRTVGFALEASWFNSGCTEVLRDFRFMLYDPTFRRKLEERRYLDAAGQPRDTVGCVNPYQFDRGAFSSYGSLAAAGLAPAR